jgi:hypothetical protein
MEKKVISTAANTVVPALLALEHSGFAISVPSGPGQITAVRGDEKYAAHDAVSLLGLVKLVEVRSWNWRARDDEIEQTLSKYHLA